MRPFRVLSLAGLVLASALSCGGGDDNGGPSGPYDAVPVTTRVSIAGLTGPVDVVRDTYGMIHIRATSIEDAARVEGYQVARDRTAQLELIRRTSTGRMAELFADVSPGLIDADIAMRTIGLARTAKKMLEQAPPDVRRWIDAYADGISQFNARVVSGDEQLPTGMIGLPQAAFVPWTAEDVVAVGRFQAMNLGYQADDEIAQTDFVEAARTKLVAASSDPALAKRAGFLVDLIRFAPVDPTTSLPGFPNDTTNTMSYSPGGARVTPVARRSVRAARASREALVAARGYRKAMTEVRKLLGDKGFTGSNNWIVGPSRSATGHALLASDPHLSLSAPAVFWMVQVTVDAPKPEDRMNFSGLSFPGIPAIILGSNENVAWGATTADYDVTDVYEETLTPDGGSVVFRGQNVPLEKVHETILVSGKAPIEYDVLVVPHHGPIVPTITPDHAIAPPSGKALSVRWTGHEPTKDLEAVFGLVRSKNVDDARAALENFAVGAQNWVVADTAGNIFYTSHALIPKRDKAAFTWDPKTFTGTIPCFVLPGDGSAEWTGAFLEDAYIPHVKNPQKGFVATANADQVGVTLDNDPTNDTLPNGEPVYTGCWHDVGFRLGRITQRIESVGHPMTLDDLASIQADARSAMGSKLAPQILTTLEHAAQEAAAPGTRKDIAALVASDRYKNANVAELEDLLTRWGAESDYDTPAGVSLDDGSPSADPKEAAASRATTIFNAWLVRMVHLSLDDELEAIGAPLAFDERRMLLELMLQDPKTMKTFDLTLGDSILFDDLKTQAVTETRDERILASLLDAVDFLRARLGADTNGWRWGKLHTIRFDALVSLWTTLSIPPKSDPVFPGGFPRHGDGYNVDVAAYPLPAALDDQASFMYSHGPTQRFVIDMDPKGPIGMNALPGGNVWDANDPHFRDEAERWRKNQNRPVPFATADVVKAAESRTVYESR